MRTVVMVALLMAAGIGCNPTDSDGPSESVAPDAFHLPRHANLSSTPTGLAEGTLQLRGQCLYLGLDLLIWPEQYRVGNVNGRNVVIGDKWTIAPGDSLAIDGGG